MKDGKLVPPEFTVNILVNAMIATPAKSGVYLVDGFPREVQQATLFEKMVCEVHQVLFYDVPQEVLTARCLKRAENSGRADDNPETIAKRVQTYVDQSLPVIDFYKSFGKVYHIDALHGISDVYKKTKEALLPQCMSMLGPKISGKSTLGNLMAARTNMKLVDFNYFVKGNGLVGQSDEVITSQLI
jgi:UMP-CMP kinase